MLRRLLGQVRLAGIVVVYDGNLGPGAGVAQGDAAGLVDVDGPSLQPGQRLPALDLELSTQGRGDADFKQGRRRHGDQRGGA